MIGTLRDALHDIVNKADSTECTTLWDALKHGMQFNKEAVRIKYTQPVLHSTHDRLEIITKKCDIITGLKVNEEDLPVKIFMNDYRIYTMTTPELIFDDPFVLPAFMYLHTDKDIDFTVSGIIIVNKDIRRDILTYSNKNDPIKILDTVYCQYEGRLIEYRIRDFFATDPATLMKNVMKRLSSTPTY